MRKIAVFLIPALAVLFAAGCEVRVRPGIPPGQAYPPDAVDAVTEPSPARTVIRTVVPQREYVFYIVESGVFELPITGASGYAAIFLSLHEGASESSNVTSVLPPGQGFTILGEYGQWWYIAVGNVTGWVLSKFCMINLPDVIPSIVYNITNHSYSLFRSSGRDIPNITGAALYHSRDFNARLGREEYIAPVLYGMARKIGAAQQAALAQGNTLIMYEAFRPADAHNAVYENLHRLHIACPIVYAGMSTPPWNTRWFLAASPYNHQRGTAVDVSLARIDRQEIRTSGDFAYTFVSGFTAHQMQTPVHELSIAAVVFAAPVHSRCLTAWMDAEFADEATEGTILLHSYMTDAGLIPLASEWWHFNDLIHTEFAVEWDITGEFHIERTYSMPPWILR